MRCNIPRVRDGEVPVNIRTALASATLALAISCTEGAFAATCLGNCGQLGADGVVTAPPGGGNYTYISTYLGKNGVGELPSLAGTNGTLLTGDVFTASAGQTFNFYFNYVTSDGVQFQDYAWAQLQQIGGGAVTFFTETTNSTPAIANPGVSTWSPLGPSSGTCYVSVSSGCGYSGWLLATVSASTAGQYRFIFGVTNLLDTAYDSGLAISPGISGIVNQTPLPSTWTMMLIGLGTLGLLAASQSKKDPLQPA